MIFAISVHLGTMERPNRMAAVASIANVIHTVQFQSNVTDYLVNVCVSMALLVNDAINVHNRHRF